MLSEIVDVKIKKIGNTELYKANKCWVTIGMFCPCEKNSQGSLKFLSSSATWIKLSYSLSPTILLQKLFFFLSKMCQFIIKWNVTEGRGLEGRL